MKCLVVGSGGREHAIAWRLAQDVDVDEVLVVPGNPGMESVARCIEMSGSDLEGIVELARREAVDLTIAGPEAPLVAGLGNRFAGAGLRFFGPSAAAARLEGSKAFAKRFMLERGIPTAQGMVYEDVEKARTYVEERGGAMVVKADGLAAGKGVHVCDDAAAALEAVDAVMRERVHGDAGRCVVIEDVLVGEEASVFCIADGLRYVVLSTSQDHKRLEDGDRGAMTGGMGAVAPAPIMTHELLREVEATIIEPTLTGMRDLGAPYVGFLYVGLMIIEGSPYVLEYNCRLGDPEAQAVMPLTAGRFAAAMAHAADGQLGALDPADLSVADGTAACVVVAAPGYPASPEKGLAIAGLDGATAASGAPDDVVVFHAGTRRDGDGRIVTAGGRVLGVTARGAVLGEALARAYRAVAAIRFDGMQYRKDIGHRALARLSRSATEVEQV